ncbi:SdpI family protein [Candidatus Woesearchaeota archaeon]|nr:SdpI family protein [Candidatus Woesearchaeota archaeon]
MKLQNWCILIIFLILFGISFYFYQKMPAQVPIDWDENGTIQDYGSKTFWIFFIPELSVFLFLLLYYLPRYDPIHKNFEGFRNAYDWLIVSFLVFFSYVHTLLLLAMINVKLDFSLFFMFGIGILFFAIGSVMKYFKRNYFAGIRTPWTLESDVVWEKTHMLGGTLFKISGIITLVSSFFSPYGIWVVLATAIGSTIVLIWYSYYIYKRTFQNSLKHTNKK